MRCCNQLKLRGRSNQLMHLFLDLYLDFLSGLQEIAQAKKSSWCPNFTHPLLLKFVFRSDRADHQTIRHKFIYKRYSSFWPDPRMWAEFLLPMKKKLGRKSSVHAKAQIIKAKITANHSFCMARYFGEAL